MDELPISACWTLPDHVDRAAQRWPDTEALVFGEERLTFAGFAERTRAVARGLVALGVSPGQKVGVFMDNVPDMLLAIYGAARTGAVPVPINGRFKARELRFVIGHADVAVLIASSGYGNLVRDALDEAGAACPGAPRGARRGSRWRAQLGGHARERRRGRRRRGRAARAAHRRPRPGNADVHVRDHRQPEGMPDLARVARPNRADLRTRAVPDAARRPGLGSAPAVPPRLDPSVQRLPRDGRDVRRHGPTSTPARRSACSNPNVARAPSPRST